MNRWLGCLLLLSLLASCFPHASRLSPRVETIRMERIAFACDCANWVSLEDIARSEHDTLPDALFNRGVFIEPAEPSLELPDTLGYNGDKVEFTGQFYLGTGFPKDYRSGEPVDAAKVFRYTSYKVIESNYREEMEMRQSNGPVVNTDASLMLAYKKNSKKALHKFIDNWAAEIPPADTADLPAAEQATHAIFHAFYQRNVINKLGIAGYGDTMWKHTHYFPVQDVVHYDIDGKAGSVTDFHPRLGAGLQSLVLTPRYQRLIREYYTVYSKSETALPHGEQIAHDKKKQFMLSQVMLYRELGANKVLHYEPCILHIAFSKDLKTATVKYALHMAEGKARFKHTDKTWQFAATVGELDME